MLSAQNETRRSTYLWKVLDITHFWNWRGSIKPFHSTWISFQRQKGERIQKIGKKETGTWYNWGPGGSSKEQEERKTDYETVHRAIERSKCIFYQEEDATFDSILRWDDHSWQG